MPLAILRVNLPDNYFSITIVMTLVLDGPDFLFVVRHKSSDLRVNTFMYKRVKWKTLYVLMMIIGLLIRLVLPTKAGIYVEN